MCVCWATLTLSCAVWVAVSQLLCSATSKMTCHVHEIGWLGHLLLLCSPPISLGFTDVGEIFCVCDRFESNH